MINSSALESKTSQAFNKTSLGGIDPSVSILKIKSFSRYPTVIHLDSAAFAALTQALQREQFSMSTTSIFP